MKVGVVDYVSRASTSMGGKQECYLLFTRHGEHQVEELVISCQKKTPAYIQP